MTIKFRPLDERTRPDILGYVLFIMLTTIIIALAPYMTYTMIPILTLIMLCTVIYSVYIDVTEETWIRKFIRSTPHYIHLLMFALLVNVVVVVNLLLP
jgi:hypothetical protein